MELEPETLSEEEIADSSLGIQEAEDEELEPLEEELPDIEEETTIEMLEEPEDLEEPEGETATQFKKILSLDNLESPADLFLHLEKLAEFLPKNKREEYNKYGMREKIESIRSKLLE
jgi:hypothetical protein